MWGLFTGVSLAFGFEKKKKKDFNTTIQTIQMEIGERILVSTATKAALTLLIPSDVGGNPDHR